jgi:hypothetical protein
LIQSGTIDVVVVESWANLPSNRGVQHLRTLRRFRCSAYSEQRQHRHVH